MTFAELLTLQRPPVQVMRATVFFSTPTALTNLAAGIVYELWKNDYPDVDEAYPAAPVVPVGAEDQPDDTSEVPPMPFYAFEGGDKAVLLQADRLGLTWNADPDSSSYPTFGVLGVELLDKYLELQNLLLDKFSVPLVETHVDIRYVNRLPGVGAAAYTRALLGGFPDEQIQPITASNMGSIRFSRHWHQEDCSVWVGVESTDEDTELDITTRRPLGDLNLRDCLEKAHEVAIGTFVGNTPSKLRQEWGQR